MTKHIFITGGVVSSLGKGITAASIAMLLRQRGYRVSMQKMDPYINVDPGTMSPFQHGEVYVTEDGAETDLDLGHYERFGGVTCTKASNFTTGRIYLNVIRREREGGYLGKTVQVIPHITNEIKCAISMLSGPEIDIVITEIGGTAGDIESLPFLEAIRQYGQEIGRENGLFIHLTLIPYLRAAGEMKTKPAQQSVAILREIGITPDVLICRCEQPMEDEHVEKLSLFCNVTKEHVIAEQDVKNSIYEVPIELAHQNLDKYILEHFKMPVNTLDLTAWNNMLENAIAPKNGKVTIGVVGKYISLKDAYKSIYEALSHAGISNSVKVLVKMIESEDIENKNEAEFLSDVDGILVPGGFGSRGVPGKIKAIKYARENNIPFFGICLGMQCAVIEFSRNVCGMTGAHSAEFSTTTEYPVIDLMEDQKLITAKGGTMRLGSYPCVLSENTFSRKAYGEQNISERHRHRYELNTKFLNTLADNGLVIAGTSPDKKLVEVVELKSHPWFVACQYHPEFKSTPLKAHPLFRGFVKAAMEKRDGK